MNQKLSDWASIAEILSGLAVVVTLIFLILGIRDNTAVLRGAAYSNALQSLNELQTTIMMDADLASAWSSFINRQASELEESDRERLNLAVLSLMRIYEAAYFQHDYGLIGEQEWARFSEVGCLNYDRVQAYAAGLFRSGAFSQSFVTYLTETCR